MANLIVTVVAIVLVAVVTLMAVWYGGHAYSTYQSKARVAQYVNEAEQISGAVSYYRVNHDNTFPANMQVLLDENYLSQKPQGEWMIDDSQTATAVMPAGEAALTQCLELRKKYGFDAEANCATSPLDNKQCLRVCYDPADTSVPRTVVNLNIDDKDPCCVDNRTTNYGSTDIVYLR